MVATSAPAPARRAFPRLQAAWPLLIGALLLAAPTVFRLSQQVWSTEAGAHGPIVLITGAWLIWRKVPELRANAREGAGWLAVLMLALALPIYVFGRAYDFISLETAGLYGFGLAVFYLHFGLEAVRGTWFPLFYLAFLIPAPGWLMDDITAPLKLFVSYSATEGLALAGYPIFREGVTLVVGQYQLLVEDACSGMNSLTGLTAISLFYIYLLRGASWGYSLFLTALVIPIAVVANILRVVILVLLTYHFGDAVAQGFLHKAAGLVLFATALVLIFAVDHLLFRFWPKRERAQ